MDGKISVEYGGQEPLLFSGEDDLFKFTQAQSRAWSELRKEYSLKSYPDTYLIEFLASQQGAWLSVSFERLVPFAKQAKKLDWLQEKLVSRELIRIEDPLVVRAKASLDLDPELADFFLRIVSGGMQKKLENGAIDSSVLAWYAKGLAHLATTDAVVEQLQLIDQLHAQVQKKHIEFHGEGTKIVDDLQQRKAGVEKEFSDLVEKNKEVRDSIVLEWENLRSAYDNALKLSAPRTYWDSKRQQHGRLARNWARRFFIASILGLFVLATTSGLMIRFWGDLAVPLATYAWIMPAMMVGIPVFMLLWLLRLFGRLWSEHMTREEDARERIVMIETFLALTRSENSASALTDASQLALVLGAIFRPGPGFGSDDSPPAGLLEVLVTKLGVSKGN